MFQNSPEVDDEGYSIRPEDESEEGDILKTATVVNYRMLSNGSAVIYLNILLMWFKYDFV